MRMQATLMALATAAACGRSAALPTPGRAELPRLVGTVPVGSAGPEAVTVPAAVVARERAVLAARVPGSLLALPYREGEVVHQGAVVARIEARALGAAVAAAEAERGVAETDLARIE